MQIGDTYEYKNVVTKEITAGALGSGGLDIFATPYMTKNKKYNVPTFIVSFYRELSI